MCAMIRCSLLFASAFTVPGERLSEDGLGNKVGNLDKDIGLDSTAAAATPKLSNCKEYPYQNGHYRDRFHLGCDKFVSEGGKAGCEAYCNKDSSSASRAACRNGCAYMSCDGSGFGDSKYGCECAKPKYKSTAGCETATYWANQCQWQTPEMETCEATPAPPAKASCYFTTDDRNVGGAKTWQTFARCSDDLRIFEYDGWWKRLQVADKVPGTEQKLCAVTPDANGLSQQEAQGCLSQWCTNAADFTISASPTAYPPQHTGPSKAGCTTAGSSDYTGAFSPPWNDSPSTITSWTTWCSTELNEGCYACQNNDGAGKYCKGSCAAASCPGF